MQQTLTRFCLEYALPDEAAASLQQAAQQLMRSPAYPAFETEVQAYAAREDWAFAASLARVAALDTDSGVHTYTLQLLYCIALLPAALQKWRQAGLSDTLFHDSMADLAYKLTECHKMYGIWGSFVAGWFDRWFNVTRVALGRLQFETVPAGIFDVLKKDCCINGVTIHPEDTLINVHIPSCGHMPYSSVLDAYRQAAAFFAPVLQGRTPVFVCYSWLLWPEGEKFLPPHSNVLPFMRDYTIIFSHTDQGQNLWRSFYVEYKGDPSVLPRNSSFNRAYADWLCAGHESGEGLGVLVWDVQANAPKPREER